MTTSRARHDARFGAALTTMLAALLYTILGCSPAAPPDSYELVGAEDTAQYTDDAVSGSVPIGSEMATTADLNFRNGPSTSYAVLRVLASGTHVVTVERTTPQNGFYKVKHNGTVGWAYGAYLQIVSTGDGSGTTGGLAIGTRLVTTTDLNFRSGPSKTSSVLAVMPTGSVVTTVDQQNPENGYYRVQFQSTKGWAYGAYLQPEGAPNTNPDPPPNSSSLRDAAIARAKAGKGFSYWWGHGRWLPSGPTTSTKGSCSGTCPSCSHSGQYGADCSGYVAKIWQVPSSNSDITQDGHPYSTDDFANTKAYWSPISRSKLAPADALVYRSGSSGHIVLYSSGDGWGAMSVYECKGCATGCVYDVRTLGSAYNAIRRDGY